MTSKLRSLVDLLHCIALNCIALNCIRRLKARSIFFSRHGGKEDKVTILSYSLCTVSASVLVFVGVWCLQGVSGGLNESVNRCNSRQHDIQHDMQQTDKRQPTTDDL